MEEPRIENGLRRYRSHKTVEAAKIERIDASPRDGSATLHFKAVPAAPMSFYSMDVSAAYMAKHKPLVDGYYVRYADGYESWSPGEAFEAGYTEITDGGNN